MLLFVWYLYVVYLSPFLHKPLSRVVCGGFLCAEMRGYFMTDCARCKELMAELALRKLIGISWRNWMSGGRYRPFVQYGEPVDPLAHNRQRLEVEFVESDQKGEQQTLEQWYFCIGDG